MKRVIYNDDYHRIARLKQKLYQDELRKIMLKTGVTWKKAQQIRLQNKRKTAIMNLENELKNAEKLG